MLTSFFSCEWAAFRCINFPCLPDATFLPGTWCLFLAYGLKLVFSNPALSIIKVTSSPPCLLSLSLTLFGTWYLPKAVSNILAVTRRHVGSGCYWHLVARAQACCWTPYNAGAALNSRELCGADANSVEVEELCSGFTQCSPLGTSRSRTILC